MDTLCDPGGVVNIQRPMGPLVLVLLEDGEWSTWSDRVIADKCGVSNQFVSNVRGELSTVDSCDGDGEPLPPKKTRGKDGKLRPSKKKPKPKQKPEPEPGPITELDDDDADPGYSEAYQQLQHWWGEADDAASEPLAETFTCVEAWVKNSQKW